MKVVFANNTISTEQRQGTLSSKTTPFVVSSLEHVQEEAIAKEEQVIGKEAIWKKVRWLLRFEDAERGRDRISRINDLRGPKARSQRLSAELRIIENCRLIRRVLFGGTIKILR